MKYSGEQRLRMLWKNILQRCHNPKNPDFGTYGARGVQVCLRWRTSFTAFAADVGRRPTDDHTLDRIDGSKGYEPGNVRWATKQEQAVNRYTTRFLTHNGETLTISDWARRAGLKNATFYSRIEHGWPMERALSAPIDQKFSR